MSDRSETIAKLRALGCRVTDDLRFNLGVVGSRYKSTYMNQVAWHMQTVEAPMIVSFHQFQGCIEGVVRNSLTCYIHCIKHQLRIKRASDEKLAELRRIWNRDKATLLTRDVSVILDSGIYERVAACQEARLEILPSGKLVARTGRIWVCFE